MESTAPKNSNKPLFYTPREFHREFGGKVGRDAIYRLIDERRIRTVRISPRKFLIPASEITDWPIREVQQLNWN